jgi:hypothetical protein
MYYLLSLQTIKLQFGFWDTRNNWLFLLRNKKIAA